MRQRSSGSIGGSLSPCSVIVGYCWYEQLVVLALVTFVVVTGVICRPTHTRTHTHTHMHTPTCTPCTWPSSAGLELSTVEL